MDSKIFSIEIWISNLLRLGVIFCGMIVILGWALGWQELSLNLQSLMQIGSSNVYAPPPIHSLVSQAIRLDPQALISCGVFILIFLPILRVILTGIFFLVEKDFVFVGLSLTVLVLLFVGLILGGEVRG